MTRPTHGRRLSDDEIELWLAVAGTVAPRAGARLPAPSPVPTPALPVPEKALRPTAAPSPARLRPVRPTVLPLAPLEKRLRRRVVRGHVSLDGVMDLHGMTQAQAHGALARFLRGTAERGGKLVLVVTGKGRGGSADAGVLRRAVPHWLGDETLRGIVLGFEEAAQPHGGFGALYVRLRRQRSG